MEERGGSRWDGVDVVTLAFRGSLVNWRAAVETVLYETARRHGESPLDGGRALRRRLDEVEAASLAPGSRFAVAWEAVVTERGYRWARSGSEALQRVVAHCRPFDDVAPALERALASGLPVLAVADADAATVETALRPLDGALPDVVLGRGPRAALAGALRRAGVPAARVLHVGAGPQQLRAAASLGVRAAWLNRSGAAPRPDSAFCVELRSLHGLADLATGDRVVTAG